MSGRFRICRHPYPSPSDLALAPTRATVEAAVMDMGDGAVFAPDGHLVAFHERHLSTLERRED